MELTHYAKWGVDRRLENFLFHRTLCYYPLYTSLQRKRTAYVTVLKLLHIYCKYNFLVV